MRNDGLINEQELRKAIAILKPQDVFEVRIIGDKRLSGYFRDADTLIREFEKVDLRGTNVYITLNNIKPECFSRDQCQRFKRVPGDATSDSDVLGYDWLFIDMDPERTSGISSSDKELRRAYDMAKKVYGFMRDLGFEEPIKAVSGNGAHLLYKIGLEKNDENIELIKECLQTLDMLFSDEYVHIDTVNYNPSRICKLYGTLAQKGTSTEDRPHRFSRIIGDPHDIKQNGKAMLQKLAESVPHEKPQPRAYNNYQPDAFEIENWMAQHGIRYRAKRYKDGVKYVLDECPFNHSHKAPDSAIFRLSSGEIGFKCLHNSCQGHTWQEVRTMYEPDAYTAKQNAAEERDKLIEDGWKLHNAGTDKIKAGPITVETPAVPMFETMSMILDKPQPKYEYIRTGTKLLDKATKGLAKGEISVVSGLRGSAKSTWLSNVMANAINDGQTVICYSGEMRDYRVADWLSLQLAGKAYTVQSEKYENDYFVPDDIKRKIAQWSGKRFWLYNNDYGNNFEKISHMLQAEIVARNADLVVLDNLMALDISSMSSDKYEAQKQFMLKIKEIAAQTNTHITLVAHPRKSIGFLRLDDISGSSNISDVADAAFIVHRVNADFKRLTNQMFGWKNDHYLYEATNCIEITKSREGGAQDYFIPMYYEVNTKRLKNDPLEYVHYGWEETAPDHRKAPELYSEIPYQGKFIKLDEEHKKMHYQVITDIWEMDKQFRSVESGEEYWKELTDHAKRLGLKYDNDPFAVELILGYLQYLDDKGKKL